MKLLYAEDEAGMSEAVTDILTYHNYTVDVVYDGEEALAYARTERYDGIILDIMMPKLSGLDVLKQLRREGARTPVLLLTAKAEVEDRIEGLDLGADDYLPKPFVMGELLARVRAMLREVLMLNQGIFLSSEELLVKVWGYDTEAEIGTVWVYISYLRKRLAAFHTQVTIKAKRSIGYTLDAGT